MTNTLNKIIHNGNEYELPVTSVNGQTGDVTVETPNTKTFFINDSSEEMTKIQEAYTWVADGGEAILYYTYSTRTYYISGKIDSSGTLTFTGSLNWLKYEVNQAYSRLTYNNLIVYATDGTVTSIRFEDAAGKYIDILETSKTYPVPYIPTDPSHPTTKKYVDDKFVQTSTQNYNLFSPGLKLRAGGDAKYALLTPESNTAYLLTPYVAVTGVTLNQSSITLSGGSTYQLTATVAPSNSTYPNVTWSSSDESVATVDETGLVSYAGTGTATITATADGQSATCGVTCG